MGMLVHLSPRVVVLGSACSAPLLPDEGILAGCGQSVCWTRLFLFDILEDFHARYRPQAIVQSWVDDLAHQVLGSRKAVVQLAVQSAVHLTHGLRAKGVRMSVKSRILANSPELAKEIQRKLKEAGVSIQQAEVVRDLGVDASLTRRRTQTTQERVQKGRVRAARIRQLRDTNAAAKKLISTGLRPQLCWGHQAKGVAPTRVQELRRTLIGASGVQRTGGCTSTVFRLAWSHFADPMVFLRLELFKMWGTVLPALQEQEAAVEKTWAFWKAKLEAARHPWSL
eukprot:9466659-Pyramimonas_sp.AAC.1